jgi:pyrimidine oxygenase
MKIGLFMPTVNNGFIMSEAAPQYKPDFEYNKEVVQKAENYGMEFALSLVKYRGFGGKTNHWHWSLDSFTTIAALGAVTNKIKLIGSVGLLAHHPAVCAKHAAMIQMISGGRFWLNIVTGWQKSEYASMGIWPGDEHSVNRYDYADEYITVCKELWETGHSSFRGRYFQLDDARQAPQPPEPITIVCAGSSERGMRFVAEHGNYNFIFGTDVDALRETNKRLLAAGEKAGRGVKSIASIHCIMGDTDQEAEEKVQRYYDGADLEALAHMTGQTQYDPSGATAQILQDLRIATFMGAEALRGTSDTIAEKLDAYRDVEGLEGLMVCLDDPRVEIDRFGQQVMPKLGLSPAVTS